MKLSVMCIKCNKKILITLFCDFYGVWVWLMAANVTDNQKFDEVFYVWRDLKYYTLHKKLPFMYEHKRKKKLKDISEWKIMITLIISDNTENETVYQWLKWDTWHGIVTFSVHQNFVFNNNIHVDIFNWLFL